MRTRINHLLMSVLLLVGLLTGTSKGQFDEKKDPKTIKTLFEDIKEDRRTIARLRAELARMGDQMKTLKEEHEIAEAKSRMILMKSKDVEVERRTEIARLKVELQRVNRELEQAKKGAVPKAPEANPPAGQVEGRVQTVARGGTLTIDRGTLSGLKKGQTLEVFQVRPAPLYLGRIRIVAVKEKESEVEMVGKPERPIKVGDQVASRLVPAEK